VAAIDGLLGILRQQGANELRVGVDRAPKMYSHGTPKRLTIPETSEETLRHLLAGILTSEREAELRAKGHVEATYDGSGGAYRVAFTTRAEDGGFDAIIVPAGTTAAAATAAAPVTLAAQAPPSAPAIDESAPRARTGAELASLLTRAVEMRASDLHLMTGEPPSVRIDGKLRALRDAAIDVERLFVESLDAQAMARLAEGRSADLAVEVGGSRFRVNVYRASAGLAAAVRLLARGAPSLASLQLPAQLDDLAELPHGLVIVCGATGSGKSTTIAALSQEALRKRSVMLVGLEDPIEYTLAAGSSSLVRQRQVGRDVRDFETGLRDALREDPDVLLIGEMRDPETIGLALTAAETGHLVLTSLHSRSAASAIERIVDSYPAGRQEQVRVQLADSLRAVVAQRLLPRARGNGRIAALEVLRVNHAVAATIREGKTAQLASAMQAGKREGMQPLERCLADLARQALVTTEAARAVANDVATFEQYMRG